MKWKFTLGSLVLIVITSMSVSAKDKITKKLTTEQFSGSSISFSNKGTAKAVSISISGPNGFHLKKSINSGLQSIDIGLNRSLLDGLYHYETVVKKGPLKLFKDTMNNGRGENDSHYAREGITQSGHFRVVNGQIKTYRNIKEPTDLANF